MTLLVAAFNEEEVIEEKIRNCMELDYPRGKLRVVVASDGSSDRTTEIVNRRENGCLRLLDYKQNRGKSATLNAAIAETDGEILVMSDANTMYDQKAIRNLVRWFADPDVTAVCGRLVLTDAESGKNADGLYWQYETLLKKCEGRLGGLLGANGAIYAIRRNAYVPIPDNTVIDDFVIPLLSKLRHGGRIIYDAEAVAHEETSPNVGSEFRRRARIGVGAYQSLPLLWRLLAPKHGWTALTFFSHKVLRWLVPFLMVAALIANLFLLDHWFYWLTLAGQIAAWTLALVVDYLPGKGRATRILRAAGMFFAMNLALLVGFWRWLTMPQVGTWRRTDRKPPAGEGNLCRAGPQAVRNTSQAAGAIPQAPGGGPADDDLAY